MLIIVTFSNRWFTNQLHICLFMYTHTCVYTMTKIFFSPWKYPPCFTQSTISTNIYLQFINQLCFLICEMCRAQFRSEHEKKVGFKHAAVFFFFFLHFWQKWRYGTDRFIVNEVNACFYFVCKKNYLRCFISFMFYIELWWKYRFFFFFFLIGLCN